MFDFVTREIRKRNKGLAQDACEWYGFMRGNLGNLEIVVRLCTCVVRSCDLVKMRVSHS